MLSQRATMFYKFVLTTVMLTVAAIVLTIVYSIGTQL
jgi:hypothetical protein